MAEPCPTSNWQSGPPLIGPRRSEVDPLETANFPGSGRSQIVEVHACDTDRTVDYQTCCSDVFCQPNAKNGCEKW